MHDKSSSVISYAAGASLAAAALIYVFGPNFTLDHDSASSKRKTIVGLRNQANDCFINSVLQALAGLGELRNYLIRENHRRSIEDPRVYATLVQPSSASFSSLTSSSDGGGGGGAHDIAEWKLRGLQDGIVTRGLKDMLDALNERPIAKKAISPFPFVRVLELAFNQHISRQQQDAQEFLQIVAERLKDEYHAGQRARLHARIAGFAPLVDDDNEKIRPLDIRSADDASDNDNDSSNISSDNNNNDNINTKNQRSSRTDIRPNGEVNALGGSFAQISTDSIQKTITRDLSKSMVEVQLLSEGNEEGFPLEGKYESHIKCQSCGYTTKPREETFCSLTLAVPQVASTTLNACFDGIFKTEYIDDFKCEMCRLLQTKTRLERELLQQGPGADGSEAEASSATTAALRRTTTLEDIERLRWAIEHDPERPPEGVDLGDIRHAPLRRIAKTTRMVTFPRILAVHLSRSIYDIGKMTQKNSAMVAFPEQLPLGGLMQQRRYKLLGLVTHRGGHNSGHYEAFRRQNAPSPYPNSNTFQQSEVYSKTPTPVSTPEILANRSASPAISTPDLLSAGSGSDSSPSSPSLTSSPRPRPSRKGTAAAAADDDDNNNNNNNNSSSSSNQREKDTDTSSLRSVAQSTKSALSRLAGVGKADKYGTSSPASAASSRMPAAAAKHLKKKKPAADKWWRVSDEKVKEAKTSDVLAMQREVYLLFYELEREEP